MRSYFLLVEDADFAIPVERLKAAGVFHGTGWWVLLSDPAFTVKSCCQVFS